MSDEILTPEQLTAAAAQPSPVVPMERLFERGGFRPVPLPEADNEGVEAVTLQEAVDAGAAARERARIRQMALERADGHAKDANLAARNELPPQVWRWHEGAATALRELAALLEKP